MLIEPEPHSLMIDGSSFQIEFRREGDRLWASVTGVTGTLQSTMEYWSMIASETVRASVALLLVVDHTSGAMLTPDELEVFIGHLAQLGLEHVRTAYVGANLARSAQHETTEILARERGMVARAFNHQSEASLWLRHGER